MVAATPDGMCLELRDAGQEKSWRGISWAVCGPAKKRVAFRMRSAAPPCAQDDRDEVAVQERLGSEFAEELAFVHAVFEGFAAVNEYNRDFVGKLPAKLFVGVNINFPPVKQAAALQLDQAFFNDLAKMATLAGVDEDLAGDVHERECSSFGAIFHQTNCKES
jgi:hypothetical protein